VSLATHAWVAGWKLPLELRRAESPPWTTSYALALDSAVHESSASLPPDLLTVRPVNATGTARRQPVVTRKGLGPADENVIHPAFSDHARPLKIPVLGSIATPAPAGAKLIHPAFSDHAKPASVPHPSFVTP
jgi:hypothetical protein